jgi:hypothetical protein
MEKNFTQPTVEQILSERRILGGLLVSKLTRDGAPTEVDQPLDLSSDAPGTYHASLKFLGRVGVTVTYTVPARELVDYPRPSSVNEFGDGEF